MKTLQELGISIIKPATREGDDTTKEALYKANDVLYPNIRRYISTARKERIMKALKKIGTDLHNAETSTRATKKKQEILTAIKSIYNALKAYTSDEDEEQKQRVLKYQLSNYLRQKEDIEPLECIKMLNENYNIMQDYGVYKKLNDAQLEIVYRLTRAYTINIPIELHKSA